MSGDRRFTEVVVTCRVRNGIESAPEDAWIEVDGVRLDGVAIVAAKREWPGFDLPLTTIQTRWPIRVVRLPDPEAA